MNKMNGRKKQPFRLDNYLMELDKKGFKFKDDAITFIYFGKRSTGASDLIVSIAIEWTLKTQKRFDGSFYLALLEALAGEKIRTRKEAAGFLASRGLLEGGPE